MSTVVLQKHQFDILPAALIGGEYPSRLGSFFDVIIRLIRSLFIITITVCTLQRHFAVFRLPAPTAESLFTIVTSILEVCSNGSFSLSLILDV